MTSATEELRRLLDERGVKWTYEYGIVCFSNGERWFKAWAYNDRLMCVSTGYYTPAQAIVAMLGACSDSCNCTNSERTGTCHVDVLNTGDCAEYECSEYIMHCNGCGHEFGHVLYNEDGDVWMSEPPNYCPNCGRKVEDE